MTVQLCLHLACGALLGVEIAIPCLHGRYFTKPYLTLLASVFSLIVLGIYFHTCFISHLLLTTNMCSRYPPNQYSDWNPSTAMFALNLPPDQWLIK